MSHKISTPSNPSSVQAHHAAADDAITSVTAAVLSVSDTRTPQTDTAGTLIRQSLSAAGHSVIDHQIVKDDPPAIDATLRAWISPPPGNTKIEAIITTGGTGISSRDTTIEVTDRLLTQHLPGFGEIFRTLSYHEVGPAAMLSRATAGLADQTLLFALPGSTNAVRLALEKLILPELTHLVWERRR